MNLSIRDVSKSFGDKQILDSLSFDVADGEFVSLIGPSGSGKSTLFSLIGGLLAPDSGDIWMNEERITNKSGTISYMPQQPSLFPWRTIMQNVLLGQELNGQKETDRAMEMLEKAGLGDVTHAYPHELSGGMKQRVAFIRALLSPQAFMCLDEPFSALDDFTRMDMQKWLLTTWEENQQSVLFITHNIEEALFLSDKIIILSSNPAHIKKEISIPFSRPRDEAIMLTPEFLDWKRYVLDIALN
ncbi:ABC-type nitrate/sulfonate/bicarbonate transport system ATPase subunit [Virgibacillus natechei]|uniref:ABC-type nitrate/sulfonate/bicarbonate transport system ATPase subunit n=1 Tax=Virgibacillus natechei TaxID=1216297 RepID=A0ABS4IKL4_9BACI|nr:ABC transporter ATP-binding protein [Virgibacillus natechei]MBP1971509.1 ABC-type nitrate/sulfonate/bicarbonate transport system ATPase subunit [Virgibacillus natechei]UZD12556.1 ABC transporter ATP-binding protein [Virgibacillus natechei]